MESLGGVKVARLLNIGTYSSENKGDTTGGKNFINALYKISNSLASGSSFAFSKPKDDSGSEVTFTVYASNREKVSVNLSSYNLKSDDGSKVTTASFNNSPNGTTLTCKAKDGKSLAYDPLVSGTAESVQNIDGKWYIQVKSDKVDMFDGKGFQASDGETILVEVDQNTAATIQSNISSGKNKITVAGNVTADANGQLTMTMNQGGYAMGTDSAQVNKDWTSQHGSFYSNMVTAMAPVWSSAKAAGAGNDWKAGWNFLKSAASGSIALNF
ncbi:MAG TPA: hypothetical protein VHO90_12060 [Bacteroidales bacterium]|nr:hypothetical protein [Bacteroidales bacterium]